MTKNVLFITRSDWWDVLAIFLLGGILKERGHNVYCIHEDEEDVKEFIKAHNIEFCLFSVMSSAYRWFRDVNRKIKSECNVKTIVGGSHFTFFPQDGANDEQIDYVVVGHGEEVLPRIIEGEISNKVVHGPYCGTKYLDHMDRGIIYDRYETSKNTDLRTFITSRECPHNCKYCYNSGLKEIFRDRSSEFFQRLDIDILLRDIEKVRRSFGCKTIYFQDDDFLLNSSWVTQFCKSFGHIGIPFSIQINLNSVNEANIALLKEAGCKLIYMSIESINAETREFLGRPRISNNDLEKKLDIISRSQVKSRVAFIIGIPVQDPWKDALDNLRFAQKCNFFLSVANILQPYPSTQLSDYLHEKGLLLKSDDYFSFRDRSSIKLESPERFANLAKFWPILAGSNADLDWVNALCSLQIGHSEAFLKFIDAKLHKSRMKAFYEDLEK